MANRTSRPTLRLEELEAREVPAVLIQVDYTYDTGFFANNPEARATMERVASELGGSISADLAAIAPGGGNTWTATFHNPSTGALQTLTDPTVSANTIRLFVGARPLGGGEAGFATTTGFTASGSPGWVDLVQTRSWAGFAPWGGSIAFDSRQNWHFGRTTDGLNANELDFYSIATHELGHVLGLGTSKQWQLLSHDGAFHGASATSVNGGPVPLSPDGLHWAIDHAAGEAVSLEHSMAFGQRVGWSSLDAAALRDLGWASGDRGSSAAPAGPPGMILFAVAGVNGVIGQHAYYAGMVFPTGRQFLPFPGYAGALHQTFGDFNGDGVFDVAVANPGGVGVMAVVSGLDGRVLGGPRMAHGSVTSLFAADLDGDGRSELIAGEGAGAVYVYSVFGGAVQPYGAVSAYGESGRAAVHVVSGDVDRTGYDDMLAPAYPDMVSFVEPPVAPEEADNATAVADAPIEYRTPAPGGEVLDLPAAGESAKPDFFEDGLPSAVWIG